MASLQKIRTVLSFDVWGLIFLWLGLIGAGWSVFQGYRDVIRIQEQLGTLWVHPSMGGANWNAVYLDFGLVMGCLIVSCIGGLLCRIGGK